GGSPGPRRPASRPRGGPPTSCATTSRISWGARSQTQVMTTRSASSSAPPLPMTASASPCASRATASTTPTPSPSSSATALDRDGGVVSSTRGHAARGNGPLSADTELGAEVLEDAVARARLPPPPLANRHVLDIGHDLEGDEHRPGLGQDGRDVGPKVLELVEGEGPRVARPPGDHVVGDALRVGHWLPAGGGVALVVEHEVIEVG